MATSIPNISLARTIAQQECGSFPFSQIGDSLLNPKTAFDVKNTFAKVGNHVAKWALMIDPEMPHAHTVRVAGDAFRDVKNFIGMTEVPGKVNKALSSVGGLVTNFNWNSIHDAAFDSVGVINPVVDAAEFLNAQKITHISSETMGFLAQLNAGALFTSMIDLAIRDIYNIGKAIYIGTSGPNPAVVDAITGVVITPAETALNHQERVSDAWMILGLKMLELAKAVSYIAMATLILIGAFFTAVPQAGLWILVASTSALFFTLFQEFANRAYNPLAAIPGGHAAAIVLGARPLSLRLA